MKNTKVTLVPLASDDREQFILDNQWAFKYGAMQEFGIRDDHINFEGEIISRKTIEHCIDAPNRETYRIVVDGKKVGGVILKIDKETHHNELEILFTVLSSLGVNVKIDGTHIGQEPAELIRSFYADKTVDLSSVYTGAALMYAELPVPKHRGEYVAWQIHLIREQHT